MNYSDFPEIQDHPFAGLVYGEHSQIKILGHIGRANKSSGTKIFIVHCSVCEKDPELFGNGIFRAIKGNLDKGRMPCGCSKFSLWTEEQFKIKISRKASNLGYKFIDWAETFHGNTTKCVFSCEKHGEWSSTNIQAMTAQNHGCIRCFAERVSLINKKPDEDMVKTFLKTGRYHPDTRFTRVGVGSKYWTVECPTCGENYNCHGSNLAKGTIGCSCSSYSKKIAYVNLIKDSDNIIAIKFGITSKPEVRVKQQSSKSVYEFETYGNWLFSDVQSCKEAENFCKKNLLSGILSSEEVKDGWSETTYTFNLDQIIDIYESHGGIRLKQGEDIPWN